jgi:hypothetical protein
MNSTPVSRWLRGFDAVRGDLRVEYRLPDSWTLERLRELFDISDDDPMFDSFPVGPLQAKALTDDTHYDLFIVGLEFFLEADAE